MNVRMRSSMIVTPTLCVLTLKDPMSAVAGEDIQETGNYAQVGETFAGRFLLVTKYCKVDLKTVFGYANLLWLSHPSSA